MVCVCACVLLNIIAFAFVPLPCPITRSTHLEAAVPSPLSHALEGEKMGQRQ